MKRYLVILLLCFYLILSVGSVLQKSSTFDEIIHLTAGYSFWLLNDYRLNPENGILPQRLAALPLLLENPRFPTTTQEAWWSSNALEIGYQFFYKLGNDADRLLLLGRIVIAMIGAGTGLVVYFWSRKLFGTNAALLSTTLFVFTPTMVANGALITSDMAVTFFLMVSAWTFWTMLHKWNVLSVLLSAFSFAFLLVSKFSAPVIFPIMLLLLCIRFMFGKSHPRPSLSRIVTAVVLHMVIPFLLIWTFYGFRFTALNNFTPGKEHFQDPWSQGLGKMGSLLQLAREARLLPEAYLQGFATVLGHGQQRVAFLNGKYSLRGWWYFFPYALLVKTPLPVFGVLILGAAALALRKKDSADLYLLSPLLVLLIIYWGFALQSNLNIGHRHLLPTYPALFILAGAAVRWLDKRAGVITIAAMMIWFIAESSFFFPHHLSYFNQIVGGPKNGYKYLVDSSLDWGQDLRLLKKWLDKNRAPSPVYLSYFGTGSPLYYQIPARRLPAYPDFEPDRELFPLTGGTYCMSATMLQSVYSFSPGRWCIPYEKAYQQLLKQMDGSGGNEQARNYLRHLRLARLAAYLRKREPVSVGYSILIFQLTDEEVKQAIFGPPAELLPQIDIAR